MVKQPSEGFKCFEKFRKIHKEIFVPEPIFWCFFINFVEFARTSSLQNSTRCLILIIAVSIVAKRVLANKTVNFDAQTKAYVLI